MQTLEIEILNRLTDIAKERGITVQELIRAVVIPEWLRDRTNHQPPKRKIQLLKEK
jgi:predicted DNA-binding ribbon-helix-helix protein